jgi:hypothetical protein
LRTVGVRVLAVDPGDMDTPSENILGHPRLVGLSFAGAPDFIRAGLARHGRPIQELQHAFAGCRLLERVRDALEQGGYRMHEFGDSLLLERQDVRTLTRTRSGLHTHLRVRCRRA